MDRTFDQYTELPLPWHLRQKPFRVCRAARILRFPSYEHGVFPLQASRHVPQINANMAYPMAQTPALRSAPRKRRRSVRMQLHHPAAHDLSRPVQAVLHDDKIHCSANRKKIRFLFWTFAIHYFHRNVAYGAFAGFS